MFQQQKVAREYLAKYHTQIMSWGPFAEGKNDFFNTPVLKEIGAKHGKSLFFSHYSPETVEWFMSIV